MHEKGMNTKRHLREEKNEKKKNTYIHTYTHVHRHPLKTCLHFVGISTITSAMSISLLLFAFLILSILHEVILNCPTF